MHTGKFVTAINCMDGRVQEPVIAWMKNEYAAQFVDLITEAGPNRVLSANSDQDAVDSIKRRIEVSVKKHNSNVIAIVGHYDCAGNPNGEEIQVNDILAARELVKSWYSECTVLGLWVNGHWNVTRVD
jgi:carbonic anhydrase